MSDEKEKGKLVDFQKEIRRLEAERKLNATGRVEHYYSEMITSGKKVPKDIRNRIIADAFLGRESGRAIIGDVWRGFAIAITSNKSRIPIKIKGQVASIPGRGWLGSRIGFIIRTGIEAGLISPIFLGLAKDWDEIEKTVIAESPDIPIEEIAPFKYLSENEGLCWQKLDFNPAFGPTPTYDKLLKNIETPEQIKSLETFSGALFDPTAQPENMCILYGRAGVGKSTYTSLLVRIFLGSYGVIPSDKIDIQWIGQMIGKRLGVGGDSDNFAILNDPTIKAITGNDSVLAKLLYHQPFPVKLQALMFITSNEWPEVKNEAARRRLLPVHFVNKQRDSCENFAELLWQERAAIVYRWLEAWKVCPNKRQIEADESKLDELYEDTIADYKGNIERLFVIDRSTALPVSDFWRIMGLENASRYAMEKRTYRRILTEDLNLEIKLAKVDGKATKAIVGLKQKVFDSFYR